MSVPVGHGRVVVCSMWRNDVGRNIEARAAHLLSKTYGDVRFVWLVGDSEDDTENVLRTIAMDAFWKDVDVSICPLNTNAGPLTKNVATPERLATLSRSANVMLDMVERTNRYRGGCDEYVLFHESDLISPPDVIERLLASGVCPVAGTVWLDLPNGERVFYDTWAYRKNGKRFSNRRPYHPDVRTIVATDAPIEVDSAGSVLLVEAAHLRGPNPVRMTDGGAIVELCERLRRQKGCTIHFVPGIEIVQPTELWER